MTPVCRSHAEARESSPIAAETRLRVAMVSPNDDRTAIARYVRELSIGLAKVADVTIVTDEKLPAGGIDFSPLTTIEAADWEPSEFDIIHFQLGNSSFHHFQNHLVSRIRALKGNNGFSVVATAHDGRLGGMMDVRCEKCAQVVLRHGFAVVRNIFPSFVRMLRERKFVRNLPYRDLVRLIWPPSVDLVIAHSEQTLTMLDWTGNRTLREGRIIPFPSFSSFPKTEVVATDGPVRFLCPGLTIFPRRGLEIVIRGALGVRGDFVLRITGRDPVDFYKGLEARLQNLAKPLEARHQIEWLGFVDPSSYLREVAAADAILVSRLDSNGEVSSGIIDGLSSGKVVLASNVGTFPEYVYHDKTGLLVENRVTEWQRALQSVVSSAALRKRLGAAAREDAMTRLSLNNVVQLHLDAYRCALRLRDSRTRPNTGSQGAYAAEGSR